MGQPEQPVCNLLIGAAQLGLIAIAFLADAKRIAGQANTGCILLDGSLRHLTTVRWLHHFFSMASLRISAFSRSSAYIFFKRAFSASSSFIRDIKPSSQIGRAACGERVCQYG